MDQSESIGKDDRHLSSSGDEGSADDGTASHKDEGDMKIAAQPSIEHNLSPGQLSSTTQSSVGGGLVGNAETVSAAGVEVPSTSETAASRAVLEPSLQLDEVWRKDLGSIDLPAYVKKKATTISFPEKVSLIETFGQRVVVVPIVCQPRSI